MLNSVEHEISNAHKNIKKFGSYSAQISLECYFFLLINVEMSTIVGILAFKSKKKFMLTSVEHEKSFMTSGPGPLKVLAADFSQMTHVGKLFFTGRDWRRMVQREVKIGSNP